MELQSVLPDYSADDAKKIGTAVVLVTLFGLFLSMGGAFNSVSNQATGEFFSMSNNLLWGTLIGVEVAFFGVIARLAPA